MSAPAVQTPAPPAQAAPKNPTTIVGSQVRTMLERGTLHLPDDYSAENALKSAWLILQGVQDMSKNPALHVCTQESVINSLLDMVVQGLNPAKKQCYFIVYGKTLNCQRSYFGDMALAERLKPGVEIYHGVIYEGDEFKFETIRGRKSVSDEIDMVISRGLFLAGRYGEVMDEIRAIKEACGPAHLKVILETGELETLDAVRFASDISIDAALSAPSDGRRCSDGEVFIKTSTGKVTPAATMPVTLVMLEAIRDAYHRTGIRIGMKPAGGIRTAKSALHYLVMVQETLGPEWLTPHLFRFGASTLANDLLRQLLKELRGRYAGSGDLSEA